MSPTARRWLIVGALALVAMMAAALLLRRRPPRRAQGEGEEPSSTEPAPARARRPPRFDESSAPRAKGAELDAGLEQVRAAQAKARRDEERACLTSVSDKCQFLDPSPEALADMARCGILRIDLPDLDATEARPDEQGHVSDEAEAMAQATREVNGVVRDELRGLHADLGLAGDPAPKLSDLLEAIETGLPRADGPDIRRRIARERAGLDSPPATLTDPTERYWRLRASIGDQYEQALANKVGSARARALRKAHDGWAQRGIYVGQCQGDGGR